MSEAQREARQLDLPKLVGRCSVCGRKIQRNGVGAKWRHGRPAPDGSPNDHAPKVKR